MKRIEITVKYDGHDKVVLENSNGDTYTSKSQELMDFLHGSKPIVGSSFPSNAEVEKWFAGDRFNDSKFWLHAPFRDNGDVVGIVIDALQHFSNGSNR